MADVPKKFSRLAALGDERLRAIDGYLLAGDSPAKIAEVIQRDWGEFEDVQPGTLSKQIARYRAAVIEPRLVEVTGRAQEKGVSVFRAARDLRGNIDVMKELEGLIEMQLARVQKAYEMERDKPLLMDMVSREVAPTLALLKELGGMHLEVGVLRRAPKTIKGSMRPSSDGFGVEFDATESSDEVFRLTMGRAVEIIEGTYTEESSAHSDSA